MKYHGSTVELLGILAILSHPRATGTNGGAVKCIDIVWNAKGEDRLLGVR